MEIDASFDQMLEQRELLKGELDTELELQERKNEEHHLQNQQLQEIRQKLEASNEALHQQSLKQTEFRMLREQLETQLAEISDQSPEELIKKLMWMPWIRQPSAENPEASRHGSARWEM